MSTSKKCIRSEEKPSGFPNATEGGHKSAEKQSGEGVKMILQGSGEFKAYVSKVNSIDHFQNDRNEEYTIVNQTYWLKGNLTDEEAIEKWKEAREGK